MTVVMQHSVAATSLIELPVLPILLLRAQLFPLLPNHFLLLLLSRRDLVSSLPVVEQSLAEPVMLVYWAARLGVVVDEVVLHIYAQGDDFFLSLVIVGELDEAP
jgi:hypothetical protein